MSLVLQVFRHELMYGTRSYLTSWWCSIHPEHTKKKKKTFHGNLLYRFYHVSEKAQMSKPLVALHEKPSLWSKSWCYITMNSWIALAQKKIIWHQLFGFYNKTDSYMLYHQWWRKCRWTKSFTVCQVRYMFYSSAPSLLERSCWIVCFSCGNVSKWKTNMSKGSQYWWVGVSTLVLAEASVDRFWQRQVYTLVQIELSLKITDFG